ncbi:TPA: hypothetical protein NHZ94_000738 [Pseudomonas aeruginosa]|uniref:Cro/CI family transcriptional regulator n=1 Tax=Pseudomonas aeruginosa TaxID=287 RepID=UPI0009A24F21|nr:hypothetical protein [Pseudomonas aeruginosa]EMC2533505.1 hypothetical protein [Pseudomonas aeruginosa]MBI7024256.1 hypothetical protein [Pseudomonas aeruginosa]MBI9167855.1 hypothetical protein [Pseudomonas aeruginosa]MBO3779135.1 hypothetical protein [Pseudomonas aeruginosa]
MAVDLGIPLAEFVKGRNQPEVAEIIGVTQSAVSQMLRSCREIRVRKRVDGGFEAFEIRVLGTKRVPRAA